MEYTEEEVKSFLQRNNDEWIKLVEDKYVKKKTFERIRDLKIKGIKPSLEIFTEDLLENPLKAFFKAITKQRNLWTKINHNTMDDETREMSLQISNRYDEILKVLKNQLNLTKNFPFENKEVTK